MPAKTLDTIFLQATPYQKSVELNCMKAELSVFPMVMNIYKPRCMNPRLVVCPSTLRLAKQTAEGNKSHTFIYLINTALLLDQITSDHNKVCVPANFLI